MATNQTLKAVIALETRKAVGELKRFTNRLGGIASAVKSAFSIASVAMFGRAVINAGKDFEDAMARVKAVTNATVGEFKVLTNAAIEMGKTTKYTATEAAQALEKLSRNGMKAVEAAQALPAVLKLAQANAIDLDKAADILKVSLNMFGLTANNAAKVSDVLSTVAANTATNIEELYDAMINVAPAAKVLGFSIEQVAAAIGALAQKGVKGAAAGTQLRIGLIKMVDPKIIKKMDQLGVHIDENTMKAEGLYKTLKKFADQNISLEELTEIFSQKGAVGVQQLVNGLDDMRYIMALLNNQTGTTARMFRDGIGAMKKELDTLKSKWESTMIALFNKTNNPITGVVRLLQNMADMLRNGFGQAMLVIATVTLPLVAKAVTNTIKVFKGLGSAIKSVSAASWANIWTAVAQVVLLTTTAIIGNIQRINKPIEDATKSLKALDREEIKTREEIDSLASSLKKLDDIQDVDAKYNAFIATLDKIKALFPDLADAVESAGKRALESNGWEEFKKTLQSIYDLQIKITKISAKTSLYEAQRNKVANIVRKGTGSLDSSVPWIGGFFREYLKDNYAKGEIENIFNDIIQVLVEFADDTETASKKVQEIFDNYEWTNRNWSEELYKTWINDIKNTQEFQNALKTYQDIFKTSKDIYFEKLKIQGDIFTNALTLLGKNAPESKIKDAAREYVYNLKSLYSDAINDGYDDIAKGIETAIKDTTKTYKLEEATKSAWKQLEGEEGDKTKALAKALKDYEDEEKRLTEQVRNGVITDKQKEEQLKKVGAETWETIAGFEDLYIELEDMGDKAIKIARRVQKAWSDTKTQEVMDNIKEARKEYEKEVEGRHDALMEDYEKVDTNKPKLNLDEDLGWEDMSLLEQMKSTLKKKEDYYKAATKWITNNEVAKLTDDGELRASALDEVTKKKDAVAKEILDERKLIKYLEEAQQLDTQIEKLKEGLAKPFAKAGGYMEDLYSNTKSLFHALEDISGVEIIDDEQLKKLDAFFEILKSISGMLDTMRKLSEMATMAQDLMTASKSRQAPEIIAANQMIAASEKQVAGSSLSSAVAGGANSVAHVPYVGPALAVAATAAISAAILAMGSKKFAKGGIINYGTSSGDNTIARVNKGEMILNPGQQANLFKMLNQGSTGGGEVQFRIQGKDLIGCIRNNRLLTTGKL